MLELAAALAVTYLLVEPVLVALHECGHAIAPLTRGYRTDVFVGGIVGPTATLGPLSVTVAPRGFLAPVTYGATAADAEADRWTVVAGALGGPLVSLVLTGGVGWLLLVRGLTRPLAWVAVIAFAYLWFQTLFTLAPLRYPWAPREYRDYRSDGRLALDLLLGREPTPE